MIELMGISGSPRKGATEYALKQGLEAAAEVPGIKTELVLLRNRTLKHCRHCDLCLREESRYCLVYDENNSDIYEKFYAADAYLIGSPVYTMDISVHLSAFFSLLRPAWNVLQEDPAFFWDKAGAAIATGGTRHGGQELTINTIHGFYHTHGINVIGGAQAYNGGTIWSRDRKEQGAREDTEGLRTVRAIGQRLAVAAYLIEKGKSEFENLKQRLEFV